MKSSKGCTGNVGFEYSRSTKFKGYLKFGGVYIGVEELGLFYGTLVITYVFNIVTISG